MIYDFLPGLKAGAFFWFNLVNLSYNKIVLKYVIATILLIFLSFPAYGQDDTIPVSLDPHDSIPEQTSKETINTLSSKVSLDLNIGSWRDARVDFPDYWNTIAHQPRTLYIYKYKGFQGLIYKHFSRLASRFYKRALRNTWDNSYLEGFELDAAKRRYANRVATHNAWGEREYFFDHLPIEQGGARIEVRTIGRNYDIFSLGPLSLSNSGRVSWSGWRLSISAEDDVPSRRLRRDLDGTTVEDGVPIKNREPRNYSFGISPPKGNIYTGNNWSISGSVKLGVRVDTLSDNKSSISGSIKILGYTGYHHTPRIAFHIKARARPFINDYAAELQISILTF